MQPEQTLDIDRLAAEAGAMVEFREVLLVGGDGDVQLGSPLVEGARVVAEVLDQGRDKKVLVFKYKNKTRYRRRHGHRQAYTRLAIRQILTAGQAAAPAEETPARPARKRPTPKSKAPTADQAEIAAPEAQPTPLDVVSDSAVQVPEEEATAQAKPRRASGARKPAEAEIAAPTPEAAAEAKPRRAPRTRKAAETPATEPEGASEPAAGGEAKPARRTRAKKPDTGK